MCSVGGPMEIEILDVEEDNCECNGCGKRFRSLSKNPLCPDCNSDDVMRL